MIGERQVMCWLLLLLCVALLLLVGLWVCKLMQACLPSWQQMPRSLLLLCVVVLNVRLQVCKLMRWMLVREMLLLWACLTQWWWYVPCWLRLCGLLMMVWRWISRLMR